MADSNEPSGESIQSEVKFPIYHAGEELVAIMMRNLEENNRNPEAIEAMLETRAVAAARQIEVSADGSAPQASP